MLYLVYSYFQFQFRFQCLCWQHCVLVFVYIVERPLNEETTRSRCTSHITSSLQWRRGFRTANSDVIPEDNQPRQPDGFHRHRSTGPVPANARSPRAAMVPMARHVQGLPAGVWRFRVQPRASQGSSTAFFGTRGPTYFQHPVYFAGGRGAESGRSYTHSDCFAGGTDDRGAERGRSYTRSYARRL